MEKVTILTDKNFNKEIIDSKTTALVDFWAPWCGPCQMMAPVIEEVAADFAGKIKVCKLNVDDNLSISAKFKIMSIPTVVFFKDGKETDRIVGTLPKNALIKKIKEVFNE